MNLDADEEEDSNEDYLPNIREDSEEVVDVLPSIPFVPLLNEAHMSSIGSVFLLLKAILVKIFLKSILNKCK